jgi:hypothetical protein
MRAPKRVQEGLEQEFAGARLADRRRQARLVQMAVGLGEEPSASIPKAMETQAAEEAAYRLLRNEAVTMEGILAGHFEPARNTWG